MERLERDSVGTQADCWLDLAALECYERRGDMQNEISKNELYIEELQNEIKDVRAQRGQFLQELRISEA